MVQRFGSRRRAFLTGVVLSVAVVVGGGYAYGAITSTNNQYTGCLAGGQLSNIAIGASPLKTCQKPATQISWNQTGPPGTNGSNGTNGTNGTNGVDGVSVNSANEPAGANCANGGSKFTAANGVTFACNGAPGAKGDVGPQGAPGPQGEPGGSASIDQIPCSTEAGIDPNGEIAATVATDGTGQLSLKCVSTNPKLEIAIDLHTVCTIIGCAQVPIGAVTQVDAAGSPISGGLQCPSPGGIANVCLTQRFAQGATAHFSSTSGTTFVGCDSIDAGICTYKVTADHVIELTAT